VHESELVGCKIPGAEVSVTITCPGNLKPQMNADAKSHCGAIICWKMRPDFRLFECSGFSENSGRLTEYIFFLELKRARNEEIRITE